jgi:hypothetical protein
LRNISNETRDESYGDEGGTFTDHDDSSQEENVGYTQVYPGAGMSTFHLSY